MDEIINVPKLWTHSDEIRMAERMSEIITGRVWARLAPNGEFWELSSGGDWQLIKVRVGQFRLVHTHGAFMPNVLSDTKGRIISQLGLRDLNH